MQTKIGNKSFIDKYGTTELLKHFVKLFEDSKLISVILEIWDDVRLDLVAVWELFTDEERIDLLVCCKYIS